MGKKNAKKKKKKVTTEPEAPPEPQAVAGGDKMARWFALGLLIVGAGVFAYAMSSGPSSSGGSSVIDEGSEAAARPASREKRFRYFDSAEEGRPFPVTLPPDHFRNQGIAHAYQVAKEIPDVLVQQPCLCGCDNSSDDHQSLLDCYADEHASQCIVCLKEALLAEQMTEAGQSAQEIREAVLRHDFSEIPIGN